MRYLQGAQGVLLNKFKLVIIKTRVELLRGWRNAMAQLITVVARITMLVKLKVLLASQPRHNDNCWFHCSFVGRRGQAPKWGQGIEIMWCVPVLLGERTRSPRGGIGRLAHMDALTIFGLFSVIAMLVFYALEHRSYWFILAFALACVLGSIYGFLQGAWPFGLVEGVWSIIAARRWWIAVKKINIKDAK